MALTREEMLAQVRKKLADKKGSKYKPDENEFRPPIVKEGQEVSFKFIVLPPLDEGDTVWGAENPGKSTTDMNGLYYYPAARHWIDKRPYECPRMDGDDCPVCQLGFDLLAETEDKDTRSRIARQYLSKQFQVVNVYFPDTPSNPESVRGRVLWFAINQRDIHDRFDECINRDESANEGLAPEEQKAWGFFYLPDESYEFKLIVKHKNGFNDYGDSLFLVSTRGPIVANKKGDIDAKAVAALLKQRHDLASKYAPRDINKMTAIAKKLLTGESDDDGFDESESESDSSESSESTSVSEQASEKEENVSPTAEESADESAETPTDSGDGGNEDDEEVDADLAKLLESISK